ncbi:MAG: murein biosynthesis integral membrane protein MurJ, partial [Rhodospirillales bacterium]|nr:murein biosynthesis integral membrane protein MurJ [Rhodospirillales bacterium]
VASVILAAALWAGNEALAPWLAGGAASRILALLILVGGGLAVYGAAAVLTGSATIADLRRILPARSA